MLILSIMPTEFQEKVYREVSKIPRGEIRSYKEIADILKTSPRAVGQALKKNPYDPKVPCHRVISSDGSIGGFNGKISGKEIEKKKKMLRSEGVEI